MDLKRKYPLKRDKRPTHVFMDGGCLYVPQDKLSRFYKDYVTSLSNCKKKVCLVETCNPECFRFFLDLDCKTKSILTHEYIQNISIKIQQILNIGECTVLVGKPREIDGGLFKCGIHMIWPHVITDYDGAMAHRAKLIGVLGDEWEETIDKAVYKGGLRMPWSWKYQKGSYYEPYLPIHIVEGSGEIRDVSQHPDEFLCRISSIHAPPTSGGWFERREEIASDEVVQELQKFIRLFIPKRSDCIVKNVWKQEGKSELFLVNTNSKYCERRRGCHKSNHVYFVINNFGFLYQKCHDEECEGYRGLTYKLSKTMYDKLFNPN